MLFRSNSFDAAAAAVVAVSEFAVRDAGAEAEPANGEGFSSVCGGKTSALSTAMPSGNSCDISAALMLPPALIAATAEALASA